LKITPLDKLRKVGPNIKSPFEKLGNIQFSSWVNEVLPDALWSALIITHLPRVKAIAAFRTILLLLRENAELFKEGMLVHSQFAKMSNDLFDSLFKELCLDSETREALSPLLLIESLPDKEKWQRLLGKQVAEDAGNRLANAVANCFNHQSQASTDCRWLRLLTLFAQDKMIVDPSMEEKLRLIQNYPNEGDMRSVRPSIRAMEMITRNIKTNDIPQYNEEFWDEFWLRTECIFPKNKNVDFKISTKILFEKSVKIDNEIARHFSDTMKTTKIDPRHDAAFGLVFYISHLLVLCSANPNGFTVFSRLALRTAVETYITLSYLSLKDDPTIWLQFRNYGNGQNKLSYLKNLNMNEEPDFIKKETLEEYLNEDMWQEYLDIKLGAWDGKDLRKMAIDAGEKDFYDRYYDVLSGYVHGNWMAIRHTIFGQCINPLHRFHRMPLPPRMFAEDAVPDLIKILNLALDRLSSLYPSFKSRLHSKDFAIPISPKATADGT
jgi:hypothetical protein